MFYLFLSSLGMTDDNVTFFSAMLVSIVKHLSLLAVQTHLTYCASTLHALMTQTMIVYGLKRCCCC